MSGIRIQYRFYTGSEIEISIGDSTLGPQNKTLGQIKSFCKLMLEMNKRTPEQNLARLFRHGGVCSFIFRLNSPLQLETNSANLILTFDWERPRFCDERRAGRLPLYRFFCTSMVHRWSHYSVPRVHLFDRRTQYRFFRTSMVHRWS